jgi:hypothetical protein
MTELEVAYEEVVAEELLKEEFRYYHTTALEGFMEALALLEAGDWKSKSGWKVAKQNDIGDICFSKSLACCTAFAVVAEFDLPADLMFLELHENIADIPQWDKAFKEYRSVFKVSKHCDLVYSVMDEAMGGIISARDFISARTWRKIGDSYCQGGKSVVCDEVPPIEDVVRGEEHPGIMRITPLGENKCMMESIICVDMKGDLPKDMVDDSLKSDAVKMPGKLRKHLAKQMEQYTK